MSITTNLYLTTLTQVNAFYTSDISSIIFEFVACDISSVFNVYPTTIAVTNYGFTDVSAVAQLNIPASKLNNLFYIYSQDFSSNISLNVNTLLYGINKDFSFNTAFSSAYIRQGTISGGGTQQISDDYIRYLAYTLFNLSDLTDLFSNETNLVNEVIRMDNSFNNTINNSLSSITGAGQIMLNSSGQHIYLDTSLNSVNNSYVASCKSLVGGFLSISNSTRGRQFFTDLSNQITNPNVGTLFYIPFRVGDMLSLKLTYKFGPTLTGFPYNNSIGNRSYKIVLTCT